MKTDSKNDQAWVEKKKGGIVRRLVGYQRLEGLAAAEALTRLYAASRLFVNFFQPSFKLATKTRSGARVIKRYHAPETPCRGRDEWCEAGSERPTTRSRRATVLPSTGPHLGRPTQEAHHALLAPCRAPFASPIQGRI